MKIINRFIFSLLLIAGLFSCKEEKISNKTASDYKVFQLLTAEQSGITFNNQITETEDNNHLVWESIYNGGGVGTGDINNDGLLDLYFSGNMTADKLYLNKGNLQFEDITSSAGIKESDWSSGVTFADVNNDGFVDIYVCKMSWFRDSENKEARSNKLYINNGDLTFTESAKEYKINDVGHSTHASFFDYDKDGLLDLYVMNAPSHRYDQKLIYMNEKAIPYDFKDHLYRNNGKTFDDVTTEVIGDQGHAYGLGLATQDFNQDGWTDIYVANDFERPDLLLINDKQGKFTNKLQEKLKHISYSSMGMDAGDINNDGLPDIAVLDMQSNDHVRSKTNMPSMDIEQFWQNVANGFHFQFMSNMVQLNNGSGFFSEIGQLTGMASTDWSWSILLSDFNNDRYKDAIITNGINRNIKDNDFNIMMQENKKTKDFKFLDFALKTKVEKVENYAYQNINGTLHFEDVSKKWGFNHNGFSFGAASADLDNDGDLDLIVNNNNEESHIYENQTNTQNNYLRINPTQGKLTAWNSKAFVKYDDQIQMVELHNVRGYQSTSEPYMHFGLGNVNKVDELLVVFPDGKFIHDKDVKSNQFLQLDYKDAKGGDMPDMFKTTPLLQDVTKQSGIEYFHVENAFNDFDNQILIPHMESRNGPFASVADVNGDGLDDIFIGASKEDFGLIYLQAQDGKMIYRPNPDLLNDKQYEDMGSCFFDIDKDGDLDLYVASGGSEDKEGESIYQDRLYINQGNGLFRKSTQNLPSSNASKVISLDVNNDGYLDLFVGGRMEGNIYPHSGTSHLLINNKGVLTEDQNFKFQHIGMVTSCLKIDVNQDKLDDIIVVGEWMTPTFLINNNGTFEDKTDQYLPESLNGWWFEIEKGDLDGDGTDEILLGNIGMNNKYKASKKKPLKVYSGDFDQNNQYDIVLAKNTKYGEVPVRGFECSSQQLPMLKDKFSSYSDFAHAQITDIINVDNSNAIMYEANEFRSGYLKLVEGQYTFVPFPPRAQFSAVQGIVVTDVNYDNSPDIILAGNHFDAEVETTRHDASVGLVLLNQNGDLKELNPTESGLYLPGNVKDVQLFEMNGKKSFLVTNNNNRAQVIELK